MNDKQKKSRDCKNRREIQRKRERRREKEGEDFSTCILMLSCCGAKRARSRISPRYASCALMTSSRQHALRMASCSVSHADSIT